MSRPRCLVALSFTVALASAAAPAYAAVTNSTSNSAPCSHVVDGGLARCTSYGPDGLQLALPDGLKPCPNSGAGAACVRTDALNPDAGVASTPSGASTCDAVRTRPPAPRRPHAWTLSFRPWIAEVAAAQAKHMGILPIYNERDCSNVSGYDTGRQYAAEAVAAASALGIPERTSLAIDIEPPGPACPGAVNVDADLVTGWYDGITTADYVPAYYENGPSGSEFAIAWCRAVSARPEIASASYLWAFHPSLLGSFNRATAPGFSPNDTGCGGNLDAWQYQIDIYSRTPDVDQDEALSEMPLWYP